MTLKRELLSVWGLESVNTAGVTWQWFNIPSIVMIITPPTHPLCSLHRISYPVITIAGPRRSAREPLGKRQGWVQYVARSLTLLFLADKVNEVSER